MNNFYIPKIKYKDNNIWDLKIHLSAVKIHLNALSAFKYHSPVKHHENIFQNNSTYNYLDRVYESWAKMVSKIATVKESRNKQTLGNREILQYSMLCLKSTISNSTWGQENKQVFRDSSPIHIHIHCVLYSIVLKWKGMSEERIKAQGMLSNRGLRKYSNMLQWILTDLEDYKEECI